MGKEDAKKRPTSKKKLKSKVTNSTERSGNEAGNGKRRKPSSTEENEYLLQVMDLKATCPDWNNLFSKFIDEDRRILQWQHASAMGEPLMNTFAWAVPSDAAIKLLTKFSPLVEMGAGKGYWAHLVQKQGGYVKPFDITVPAKSEAWTKVYKGTPESILTPAVAENKRAPLADLNLFLCYPDQGNEVGLPSVDFFQTLTDDHNNFGQGLSSASRLEMGGGYVIHVGELLVTGCVSGAPQAPWGRTSSPDFQQRLYADYHCVLTLPLESFPFSRDFLTVWKRTVMFDAQDMEFDDVGDSGGEGSVDEGDNEEEISDVMHGKTLGGGGDDDSVDDLEDEEEENEDEWADIPDEERLPHTVVATAAPCMQHLLRDVQV